MYQSAAIGAVADALLLSLALADRIRLLQRAQLAAEEQARRNLAIRREELERLVAERTAEIKTLHGILPICANCKKIRTDDGAWQALETTSVNTPTPSSATAFATIVWQPCTQGSNGSATQGQRPKRCQRSITPLRHQGNGCATPYVVCAVAAEI